MRKLKKKKARPQESKRLECAAMEVVAACPTASPFRISLLTLSGIALYSFSPVGQTISLPINVLRLPAAKLSKALLCDQSGMSQRLAELEAEFHDLFVQFEAKRQEIQAVKASLLACDINKTHVDINPSPPTITPTDSQPTTTRSAPISVSSMQEVNSNFNSKYNLLEGTRLCRLDDPYPILESNSSDLSTTMFRGMGLNVRYQCAGPSYDKFTEEHLLKYIQKKQKDSPEWGTRPTIVPSSTTPVGKSMSVLVLGNSHMRQIAAALMCQFRDQFLSKRDFEPFSDNMGLVGSQYTFALGPKANLTLTVMANHPAIHSVQWKANIEEFLQHPLDQVDALVQGQYNPFLGERYRAAKSWQSTQKYKEDYPQHKVDYETITHGIDLRDMLNAYEGPVVYLSSFAAYNMGEYEKGVSLVKEFAENRTSTKYYTLNAREHLHSAEMGRQECAQADVDHIGDCVPNNYWHRCMGDKGGEPDILAMGLVNALWKIHS